MSNYDEDAELDDVIPPTPTGWERIRNGVDIDRIRGVVDAEHLDKVAVIWMTATLLTVIATIYMAMRVSNTQFSGTSTSWERVRVLAQSGSISFAAALAIGVAVVALRNTAISRAGAWMGLLGACWLTAAGAMNIAYQLFSNSELTRLSGVDGQLILSGSAMILFGGVLVAASWFVLHGDDDFDDIDEAAFDELDETDVS